jgi:S1-C subfamily serine protease
LVPSETELDFDAEPEGLFDNIVKIFTTIQEPDYANPWQTKGVEQATGSGVVIETSEKLRILTAAHVVADRTFVQVQKKGIGHPDKYEAVVYAVWHECDLALLDVEDSEAFWQNLEPSSLGAIPQLRSIVLVAGFPIGGEELSVTEGVVSRIEGQPYIHSQRMLLAVTIDAAVQPGHSGGPAFNTAGELIGIAFQELHGSNTGHIIPPPVIQHFLEGISMSGPDNYRGFPRMGLESQELTNPHLRQQYNLDDSQHGILVNRVMYGNSCYGILKSGDVLTRVDNQDVANNGTIAYGRYGRVRAGVIFSMFQCGEMVSLDILRDGKPLTVQVKAKPPLDLVQLSNYDRKPPFFVYCGLVFQPLSLDFIESGLNGSGQNPHFFSILSTNWPTEDRLEVVVFTQALSDRVNVGYEELVEERIEKVNGEKIRDLKDLVEKIEKTTDQVVVLETCCECKIILPSTKSIEAIEANRRILSRYSIQTDRWLE